MKVKIIAEIKSRIVVVRKMTAGVVKSTSLQGLQRAGVVLGEGIENDIVGLMTAVSLNSLSWVVVVGTAVNIVLVAAANYVKDKKVRNWLMSCMFTLIPHATSLGATVKICCKLDYIPLPIVYNACLYMSSV